MINQPTNHLRRQQILAELSRQPLAAPTTPTPSAPPMVAAPVTAPCPAPRELENLVAGRLRGKQLASVAEHVAECKRCADYAEEIHRMVVRPALATAARQRTPLGALHIAGLTVCAMLAMLANTGMIDAVTATTANGAQTLRTTAPAAPTEQPAAAAVADTVVVPAESLAAPTRGAETAEPAVAPSAVDAVAPANNEKQKETASAAPNAPALPETGQAKDAETSKPEAAKMAPKATPGVGQPAARASQATKPESDGPVTRKIENEDAKPARLQPARI